MSILWHLLYNVSQCTICTYNHLLELETVTHFSDMHLSVLCGKNLLSFIWEYIWLLFACYRMHNKNTNNIYERNTNIFDFSFKLIAKHRESFLETRKQKKILNQKIKHPSSKTENKEEKKAPSVFVLLRKILYLSLSLSHFRVGMFPQNNKWQIVFMYFFMFIRTEKKPNLMKNAWK